MKEFSTSDLALATFLSYHGLSVSIKKSGETAVFNFAPVTDEEQARLDELKQRYEKQQARVEPLGFTRQLGLIRSRMYDVLDGKDRHRRDD